VSTEQRRHAARVDAAYCEWMWNREDVERLRALREAVNQHLDDRLASGYGGEARLGLELNVSRE
jgi:hypothetical protein